MQREKQEELDPEKKQILVKGKVTLMRLNEECVAKDSFADKH